MSQMCILDELKTKCTFNNVFADSEKDADGNYKRKIGHIRADHDGYRWYNTVWPCHKSLTTEERAKEIDSVYQRLTARDAFSDIYAMRTFCEKHREKAVVKSCEHSWSEFNFYYEGEHCLFWIRCIPFEKNYNLYLHAFTKES